MTSKLDKSRLYGTIIGASDGSQFHQDGKCFRSDGTCVDDPADEAGPAVVRPGAPEPVAAEEEGVSCADLEALHPSKIKALVEAAGLELEKGPGSKARNIENLLAQG